MKSGHWDKIYICPKCGREGMGNGFLGHIKVCGAKKKQKKRHGLKRKYKPNHELQKHFKHKIKELELELIVRNNKLRERRLACGLEMAELAERMGMSVTTYHRLETMRVHPYSKRLKDWIPSAKRVAEYYGVPIRELFPDSVINLPSHKAVRRVDPADLELCLSNHTMKMVEPPYEHVRTLELRESIEKILFRLTKQEEQIVMLWFGLDGLGERTSEDIREILNLEEHEVEIMKESVIKKLRQPNSISRLMDHME